MKTVRATRALATANVLGEGIVWCARARVLYWTDIQSSTLWRHDPATGRAATWPMPERLAAIALCEDPDWLLLGLATRLAFLHLPSGRLEAIMDVEPGLATRVNDGACDRRGRFVFGTLHEGEPQRPLGAFYRLDTDLSLHRLELGGVAVSNSIAFSPDGGTLYYCDSLSGRIRCCAYGENGSTGTPRDFAELGTTDGVPDGSAVDTEGGLWNAQWGLGRVLRYAADGTPDFCIEVPTPQPTRPTFGGPDLDTLYITSARDGLPAAMLRDDAGAGDLYLAVPGFTGLPEPRFGGQPRQHESLSRRR